MHFLHTQFISSNSHTCQVHSIVSYVSINTQSLATVSELIGPRIYPLRFSTHASFDGVTWIFFNFLTKAVSSVSKSSLFFLRDHLPFCIWL